MRRSCPFGAFAHTRDADDSKKSRAYGFSRGWKESKGARSDLSSILAKLETHGEVGCMSIGGWLREEQPRASSLHTLE